MNGKNRLGPICPWEQARGREIKHAVQVRLFTQMVCAVGIHSCGSCPWFSLPTNKINRSFQSRIPLMLK